MTWSFYASLYFLAAALTLGLAILTFRRSSAPGSRWFAGLMVAVCLWTLLRSLEAAAPGVTLKIFFSKIEYFGMANVPPLWLMFCFTYRPGANPIPKKYIPLLWIIPSLMILTVLTNDYHHLFWVSVYPAPSGQGDLLVYQHGILFWVALAHNYLLMAISAVWIVQSVMNAHPEYRLQSLALLAGASLAWILNIISSLIPERVLGLDLTPFGFALGGLIVTWSIFRHHFLVLLPVARSLLVENMPGGMIVLDLQNKIVDINPAAQGWLTLAKPLGVDLQKALAEWPALALASQAIPGEVVELSGPLGSGRSVEARISSLQNHAGQAIGKLIYWQDITQRKRLEAEYISTQRSLAAMEERAQMSRELHDSLGQVLSFYASQSKAALQLVERGQPAIAATYLTRLSEVASDANVDLREYILNLRAGEENQDFFQALNGYLEHFSKAYGLPVSLSLPPRPADDLLPPKAQVQLLHIIREALANIRKHAQAHRAQVIFTLNNESLQVVIADDGVGFDPAQVPNDGHFGLQMFQERARQAGGNLEVRSAPDQGTQVVFTLPCRPLSLSPMRVLLADDHPLVLEGLNNLLTGRGLEVVGMARNGQEAVTLSAELRPDLALLDMQMPGLGGAEAAGCIKAASPETKVVILTISASNEDLFAALRAGADGYLLKSQDAEAFFAALAGLQHGEMPIAPGLSSRLLRGLAQPEASLADMPVMAEDMLSAQQVEMLGLLAQGMTHKQIAAHLYMSERTVRYHLDNLRQKLGAESRAGLIAAAIRIGLVKDRRKQE